MKRRIVTVVVGIVLLLVAVRTEAAMFSDVAENHSLAIEIEYLANQGVISGYSDGTFKPNAPITKKHIAKMLVHARMLPMTNLKPLPYKDVPVTHPYYKEISAAYTAGIFGDAEYFRPESSISRAFMAKIISTTFSLKSIADNAMTYVDVPTTHAFYTSIQLVTMNNIAYGYELSNGYGPTTYAFAPNDLLTRAHFSAFLARAMSLQAGDYTPDTRYTYTYEHATGLVERHVFYKEEKVENGTETFWDVFVDGEEHYGKMLTYYATPAYWHYAEPELFGFSVTYPFTIGYKRYDHLDYMYDNHRRDIVETNARYKIADMMYDAVVVVRDRYWDEELVRMTEELTYISKGYGVIAKAKDGQPMMWLAKRE